MDEKRTAGALLDDVRIPVRMKISAVWVSVMFCYVYGDYFGLYVPGKLKGMLNGTIAPLGPVTQGVLVGTSVMMALPSLMVFLSLVLKPDLSRWVNIILGVLYTLIILVTMWYWAFYIFLGIIEMALTALIVWYAWRWPRQKAA